MMEDLSKWYTQLVAQARITLVEAGREILNTFDEKLRRYATDVFRRERISVLTGSPVVKVEPKTIRLADGSMVAYGLLLWSTGNAATAFGAAIDLPKDKQSRIIVDEFFRVKGHENIYSLGDCSVIEQSPLPATSQVAQQQGKYLARSLNKRLKKVSRWSRSAIATSGCLPTLAATRPLQICKTSRAVGGQPGFSGGQHISRAS